MIAKRCTIIFASMLIPFGGQHAFADGGLFDFFDPCIAAKDTYWTERERILATFDEALAENPNAQPTAEFKKLWWEEKRAALRAYFDNSVFPLLVKLTPGVTLNKDQVFEAWLASEIDKGGGQPALDAIMTDEFRRVRQLALEKQRGGTIGALNEQKNTLYDQCPEDVANQVFRGTITIVAAPIGLVSRNLDIAKKGIGSRVADSGCDNRHQHRGH